MTIDFLKNLSMISYILSGILLVISVILFFILRIPLMIRELTGTEAKKAIQNIQRQNENGQSIDLQSEIKQSVFTGIGKEKRQNKNSDVTDVFNRGFNTAKIDTLRFRKKEDETTLLDHETEDGTALLQQGMSETTLLESAVSLAPSLPENVSRQEALSNEITVLFDITYIHTEEWIE